MAAGGDTLQRDRARESENGLGHARVIDIQRGRLLAAMAQACVERGAANVTVAQVVQSAGVSRRTFYEVFDDVEDCLTCAIDDALAQAAAYVLPVSRAADSWRGRMRAGLEALLRFIEEEPYLGRLLIVETLGSGQGARERRERVVAQLAGAVDAGRTEAKGGTAANRLTAEGVVGSVLSILHARLVDGEESRPLGGLAGPLMSMIVLPYLGVAAARRELQRPTATPAPRVKPASSPLPRRMRLTYRTVRVLAAVAANPGASNRAIGIVAGVGDQGQISKLLGRLERLELIENSAAHLGRGEPNAWVLARRGEEVNGAFTARKGP